MGQLAQMHASPLARARALGDLPELALIKSETSKALVNAPYGRQALADVRPYPALRLMLLRTGCSPGRFGTSTAGLASCCSSLSMLRKTQI